MNKSAKSKPASAIASVKDNKPPSAKPGAADLNESKAPSFAAQPEGGASDDDDIFAQAAKEEDAPTQLTKL